MAEQVALALKALAGHSEDKWSVPSTHFGEHTIYDHFVRTSDIAHL